MLCAMLLLAACEPELVAVRNVTEQTLSVDVAVSDGSSRWTFELSPGSARVVLFFPTRDSHLDIAVRTAGGRLDQQVGYFTPSMPTEPLCLALDTHALRATHCP